MAESNKVKEEYMFLKEKLDEQQKSELRDATQSTCNSERSRTVKNPSGKCGRKGLEKIGISWQTIQNERIGEKSTRSNSFRSLDSQAVVHSSNLYMCATKDVNGSVLLTTTIPNPMHEREWKEHKKTCEVCIMKQ